MLRCTEVTEGCVEVQRGVCRGVGRCMEGMWMCRGAWTGVQCYMEVCRGAQRYVQRCVGEQVHGGVYGGARRWTEGCVEVDRECTEVCRGLYRGMQRYVEVQRRLQRYVEVHERYVGCVRRYMEGCADV